MIYDCFNHIRDNGDTPKWLVYFMENPIKADDLGNTQMKNGREWLLVMNG